jgi:fermentation-respiration switch protein FrsA (DUF1100 family)
MILISLSGCMEMDSFLFNTEKLERYSPKFVPDSLLEPVSFLSDGNRLYGYWVRSDGRRPKVTILYFHGNKHHMDEYWDRVDYLRQLGVNVLVFDYRGFGMSEGQSSEAGMYADAEAALAYVHGRRAPGDTIIYYGFSLGSVGAIHLAGRATPPYRLIVESGLASATSLVQGASVLDFPSRWLTDGTFDNARIIRSAPSDVLIIHGTADDFVRFRDNGLVLFDNAGEDAVRPIGKTLEAVPDAGHSDVPTVMVDRYLAVLREFIGGF